MLIANVASYSFQQANHVDLFDLARYAQEENVKNLPTHTILRSLIFFPQKFFFRPSEYQIHQPLPTLKRIKLVPNKSNSYSLRYVNIGPEGQNENVKNRVVFKISNTNESLRRNAVFGVEFEDIQQLSEQEYKVQLITFIHDDHYLGYYFRRLEVFVNYNEPTLNEDGTPNENRVKALQWIQDIPLADTSFTAHVDILARKVILKDSNHNITKVFPIGTGAFDIRTLPSMDGTINSMTPEFAEGSFISKDPSLIEAINRIPNFRYRTHPSYYKGRPFIGIASPNGRGGYYYRQIGLHYQIDSSRLRRGFISHGCIRVSDHHLYDIEAIVFEGPQDMIPIQVKNHLPELVHLDHPYPRLQDRYSHITYTSEEYESYSQELLDNYSPQLRNLKKSELEPSNYVLIRAWCKARGRGVRIRQGRRHGVYKSVWDRDCLTATQATTGDVQEIIDYILGESPTAPIIYEMSPLTTFQNLPQMVPGPKR